MTLEQYRAKWGDAHLRRHLTAQLYLGFGPKQIALQFGCSARRLRAVMKLIGIELLSERKRDGIHG